MYKYVTVMMGILLILTACTPAVKDDDLTIPEDAVARVVYFYAENCALCQELYDEVLQPLIDRCGDNLEIKAIQIDTAPGFEVFIDAENALIGDSGRWDIPTVVVGETYFIGEDAIQSGLLPHLQCVFGDGGNDWPDIPSLQALEDQDALSSAGNPFSGIEQGLEECVSDDDAAVCASPNPIFVLYLSNSDCETGCDRTVNDLRYLQGLYPQMFYEEKDIEENKSLAKAIVKEFGLTISDEQLGPAIVVGSDYLTGDALALSNLKTVIGKYGESGALAVWYTLDVE